jgi:hypothetical protein
MNIPVSDFFKSQLHTQVTLPMGWNKIGSAPPKDYSLHNLNIFNLWQNQAEHAHQHSDTFDKHSAEMVRIEHKLDLMINLFQQFLSQQTNINLSLSTVLISVAGIRWFISDAEVQPGEMLSISLSLLLEHSQLPIYLNAKVIYVDNYDGRILCTAKFMQQSDAINELMDKWIFNLHRHEIANLRQK